MILEKNLANLEAMNQEALQIFEEKKSDLRSYGSAIDEAERMLTFLHQTLDEKRQKLSSLSSPFDDSVDRQSLSNSLAELEAECESQIRALELRHGEECSALQSELQQALDTSDSWASRHLSHSLEPKRVRLEALKSLEAETKAKLQKLTIVRAAPRAVDEKQVALARRISAVEQQIAEVTSITREEMREARAKIEESIATVELRQRSHAAEIRRLEAELDAREEKYEAHLSALQEQYDVQKRTIEQTIEDATARAQKTQQIIEQLGERHQTQLAEVLDDMKQTKRAIAVAQRQTRDVDGVRSAVREIETLRAEKRMLADEMNIMAKEIADLDEENEILSKELVRLNSTYRSMMNK
jgi:chromosome segregation ATPase